MGEKLLSTKLDAHKGLGIVQSGKYAITFPPLPLQLRDGLGKFGLEKLSKV